MDGTLLPLLIAATVALFAWWAFSFFFSGAGEERRKLQERLSTEGPGFGSDAARPLSLINQEEAVPTILAGMRFIQSLQRKLALGFPDLSLSRFLLIVAAAIAAFFFAASFLFDMPPVSIGAAVVGGYLPFLVLSVKRNQRQRTITMQLPEALDFLSRVMRAGHSFSTGLQMMSEELPEPLSGEFRRCYDQHSLGQGLEESMKEMATRVDSTDFAFFVTAVLIQRQAGGDLSEVLDNISAMIRQRLKLVLAVKAKTAEGRLTGYIMVAFPGIMFCLAYYLNPEYGGILLHTNTGLKLLGTAFGLQMLGLFMIKKITTVKV